MPRTDLEQLVYTMSADIKGMQRQLQRAVGDTDRASRQIERRIERQGVNVGKALRNVFDDSRLKVIQAGASRISVFGSALAPLGPAGLAAAAGVAALVGIAHEARDAFAFVDELHDLAHRFHVTTDELQEYRYAVRAAGGDEAGADAALEAFSITLGKAQEGLTKAKKGFKALGFSEAEIKSWKTVQEALDAVAAKIAKIKTAPQRDAAIDQLGLSGMKELVQEGAAGMARLRQEAHAVGVVMDSDLIRRTSELNDQYETLSKRIGVELKSSVIEAGPALLGLLKIVAKMATEAGKVVDAFQAIESKRSSALQAEKAAFEARQSNPAGRALLGWNDRPRLARINKEIAARAKANAAPTPPDGGTNLEDLSPHTGPTAAEKRQRGLDALASAVQAAIRAQAGLTDNIEELARLKAAEVDAELKKTVDRLKSDIAEGKIDKALAQQAIAQEQKAALDQKALIRREAEERLEDQYFDRQRRNGDLIEQAWQIEAALSRTVQARLEIERRILLARQREERAALERSFDRQRDHGTYSDSAANSERASLAQRQGAEIEGIRTNAVRDLAGDFRDALQVGVDALRGKADVMEYLADKFNGKLLDGIAEWAASQVLGKGGNAGNIFATVASVLGFGKRAGGGPISAGSPYLVGERGPELVIPGRSGTVIPNHALGGLGGGRNVSVTMTINAPGAMMAQEFVDFVHRSKAEAIQIATVRSVSAAASVVPARMMRQARQRTGSR